MLERTRMVPHRIGRIAISIVLTGALLMPAFPLSEVVPAYADPVSSDPAAEASEQTISLSLDERINMDVPIDGTVVVAQGQVESPSEEERIIPRKTEAEKQAILDGYLADGTITEDDLDNEFIVSTLTESYLEQDGDGGGRPLERLFSGRVLKAHAAIALMRTAASLLK